MRYRSNAKIMCVSCGKYKPLPGLDMCSYCVQAYDTMVEEASPVGQHMGAQAYRENYRQEEARRVAEELVQQEKQTGFSFFGFRIG